MADFVPRKPKTTVTGAAWCVAYGSGLIRPPAICVAKYRYTLDFGRYVTPFNTATAVYCVVVVVTFDAPIACLPADRTADPHQYDASN